MLEKAYKVCDICGVRVFTTLANPDATCEYMHCRLARNDPSTEQSDETSRLLFKKYVGVSVFVPEAGAPLRCVGVKYPNLLICMSDWQPDQYVFTPEEFVHILKTQSLPH